VEDEAYGPQGKLQTHAHHARAGYTRFSCLLRASLCHIVSMPCPHAARGSLVAGGRNKRGRRSAPRA